MDSAGHLNQLQKLARAGKFSFSFSDRTMEIAPDLNRILGRPDRAELMSLDIFLLDLVYYEDQNNFRDQLLASEISGLFQPRPFRLLLPSGILLWFKAWGEPVEPGDPSAISGFFMDITPEKELEGSLRLQQENLRNLFESSPIPLALITQDLKKYLSGNLLFTELLGAADRNLTQQNPMDLFFREEDRREVTGLLTGQGAIRGREMEICPPGSSPRWVLVSAALTVFFGTPAYLLGFSDISRQKENERQLGGVYEALSALLNHQDLEKGILAAMDHVGRALEVSQIYLFRKNSSTGVLENWLEWSPSGTGKDPAPVWNPEEPHPSQLVLPLMMDGNFWGFVGMEDSRRTRDWQENERSLLGSFTLSVGSYIRQHLLEQEMLRAKEAAETSDRAKSEFIANMSHEIRTPLNIVLGFSDILGQKIQDPEQKSFVDSIRIGANNLLMLINDILDLSKIEAGSLNWNPEYLNLEDLVRDVLSIFSLKVREKNLGLNLDYQVEPGVLVESDEVRLRQILFNLVGNAVKFTQEGSISILIKASFPVEAVLDLIIQVEDTGVGIKPEAMEKIFESFRQQDPAISRKFGGTGLGLAITKKLTSLMGGSISVTSTLGAGSIFTVQLPHIRWKRGFQTPALGPFVPPDLTGRRILYVEDDDASRKILARIMEDWGAEVTTAENTAQTLEALQTTAFDLGILDIKIGEEDGVALAREIRGRPGTTVLPLVAFTASVAPDELSRIRQGGLDDIMTKPLDKRVLAQVLNTHLIQRNPDFRSALVTESCTEMEQKGLLGDFQAAFKTPFRQARDSHHMGRMGEFGKRMELWAQERNLITLDGLSRELQLLCRNFDLEGLGRIMNVMETLFSEET